MSETGFVLDPRLAADTCPIASLPLCDVLLMDDARYPWLILVPRQTGLVEIADLDDADQATLWQEVNQAAAALRQVAPCEKLNVAALGIVVRQLHIHVVARNEGDAAWPRPVWGQGKAAPYEATARAALIDPLRDALAVRLRGR
jgi:diadenosine tetraphosphate (Ap4A) HIT family hydrolase